MEQRFLYFVLIEFLACLLLACACKLASLSCWLLALALCRFLWNKLKTPKSNQKQRKEKGREEYEKAQELITLD